MLALAAAAAVLAITGFWVSIAADVRRRRGEVALLAALGVTRREAALQLCLEKLLISLPSAVLGVLLGTLVARRWSGRDAHRGGPAADAAAVTVNDLLQAIALALAVTVLPAVTAALAVAAGPTRRRTSRRGAGVTSRIGRDTNPQEGRGSSVIRRVTGVGQQQAVSLSRCWPAGAPPPPSAQAGSRRPGRDR